MKNSSILRLITVFTLLLVVFGFFGINSYTAQAAPAPTITSLQPTSGPVSSSVTITGSNFTPTNNTVNFGSATISNLSSDLSLTSVTFSVPSAAPGIYDVSVTNANGTSNILTFTVTTPPPPAPTIASLQPTSGPVNTTVTITGTNFTPTNNTVNFGSTAISNLSSVTLISGESITFSVPAVALGSYPVSVTNSNGTSNAITFTVTTTSSSAPTITSLQPISGPVNTSVTITGTNFTSGNNTVNFGSATISNLSSNGTAIVFTVPSAANGNYAVTVVNANGTSNAITFTVTTPSSSAPTITSLQPTSGPVNTTVTITGTNFTPTNNTVNFGPMPLQNFSSNGTSITFSVPSIASGTYSVSVTNANGSSNFITFVVTTTGGGGGPSPTPSPTPSPAPSPTPSPTPPPSIGFPDGKLLNDHGTVYVIANSQKQGFTLLPVFLGLGYKLSNVVTADTTAIPSGPVISTVNQRHPRGALVNLNGTIYFLGQSLKYPYPSAPVFFSWGNQFKDVVLANSFDTALPTGYIVSTKP